jgi:hypothetical protein
MVGTADVRERARFPDWGAGDARYESFYLKAADPEARRALWIRYTVFKRRGAAPVGSTWVTLFDAAWDRPAAWKRSGEPLSAPDGEYVRMGDDVLAPGRAQGASWDLSFAGDAPAWPYLPADWMYRAPVPRTKPVDLYPAVRFSGHAAVGDRRLELDGWRGMIGHNWGAEHAETWAWVHGTGFEEAPDALFDAVLGRIKVGPVLVPWVVNGLLVIGGERIRVGGLPAVRKTRVEATPRRLTIAVPGLDATFDAQPHETVAWVYGDPPGGEHHSLHTSTADLVLRTGGRTLTLRGGASYELGLRPGGHDVPVEPFTDP